MNLDKALQSISNEFSEILRSQKMNIGDYIIVNGVKYRIVEIDDKELCIALTKKARKQIEICNATYSTLNASDIFHCNVQALGEAKKNAIYEH